MSYIIFVGNAREGLAFYGPFPTEQAAIEWAKDNDAKWNGDPWHVGSLLEANDNDQTGKVPG